MRRSQWFRCAATTTVAARGVSSDVAPPKVDAALDATPPASKPGASPRHSFKTLRFHAWQRHTVRGDGQHLPLEVLFHGKGIGPRPLFVLDHSLPPQASTDDMCGAAGKFELIISQLSWPHGAVYVPLCVTPREDGIMTKSCETVCAVMDALDVKWTHFLTHAYGSLVGARMAASTQYPHRLGTMLVLDTPLVTPELLRAMELRRDIAKAESDVNTPAAELAFAKSELLQALEGPLPSPAPEDEALYHSYLFAPDVFERDGLVRHEERYVPVKELATIRHPLQWLLPGRNPLTDVATHKEFFGIRRPAVMKAAASHGDLFSETCAGDVADAVRSWMQRFEPDVVLQRRYEQAAKEMSQLMGAAPATAGATGGVEAKAEKKRKKSKQG